ncbi:antigen-presenting glycoprotein CD1d2-like [Heterodontus francisci]|uniref:antigen-presenting glycoprotein CD1d2-like n=1 Tax=Heterodontus francisci TaxID=7792 RepID=UPI00355C8A58
MQSSLDVKRDEITMKKKKCQLENTMENQAEYRRFGEEVKKQVREAKREYEKRLTANVKGNPKAFFRHLNTVAPQVFLSVDKASAAKPTQLCCLVTGFYPLDIKVTLLRNGKPITDTESSDILPNHDGTYQLRRWVQIEPNDRATFSCQYEQKGNGGVMILDWDKMVRTTPRSKLGLIVGLFAAIALVIHVVCSVVWKRGAAERGESSLNLAFLA